MPNCDLWNWVVWHEIVIITFSIVAKIFSLQTMVSTSPAEATQEHERQLSLCLFPSLLPPPPPPPVVNKRLIFGASEMDNRWF